MKNVRGTLSLCLVTTCLAAVSFPLAAQTVPEPSSSTILMRGLDLDFSNSADTLLSLDLNGDGKADLLYARPGSGTARAYLSHGDGTFRKVSYVEGGNPRNGFSGDLSSPDDRFLALDFNGDGRSDFIEYRPGSGFSFLCLSNGDGTVNCSTLSDPGGTHLGFQENLKDANTRLVSADLNHDGRADVIAYTPGGGQAAFYLSQPNGTFQLVDLVNNYMANGIVGFAEDMRPNDVRVVPIDANGDGYADLLVYTPTYGEVRLYVNSRNNTFQVVPLAYGGTNGYGFQDKAPDSNAHLITLDLNGDGRGDFLWWQAGSRTVTGYVSNGNGTFKAVSYLANGSTPSKGFADTDGSTADMAVPLDLNGDGISDFLWYSPGNSIVTAYVSSANGQLTSYQYQTGQGNKLGFNSAPSSAADVILPLNFLGHAWSGFVNYTPGGGHLWLNSASAGQPASVASYATRMYPNTFLRDLGWSIGNTPLKEIVMPATHDSAMFNLVFGVVDVAQTQWGTSYTDQLNAGARALDFRNGYYLYNNGNQTFYDPNGNSMSIDAIGLPNTTGYYMYGHGNIMSNYMTSSALNEVENWLEDHPDEVVVLNMVVNVDGSQRQGTPGFITMLQNTAHSDLIYTQQKACGQARCTDPRLLPQNVSIAILKALGTRLILLDGGTTVVTNTGYTWGSQETDIGYCTNNHDGRSTALDEIDCINNAKPEGAGEDMESARPSYQAADAAATFLGVKAELTPDGGAENGGYRSGLAPLTLADGVEPYGFNVGSQQYDLNQQLSSGSWSGNATNLWYVDGLRANDDLTRLILQRNNQTWTNMNFVAVNAGSPAVALAVGMNGDAWAAGSGHAIDLFKYNPATGLWVRKINNQQNIKKLAVDAAGGVWVVDGSSGTDVPYGQLFHYDANGQNGYNSNHVVQDVAVGKNGSVWAVGMNGYIFQVSGPTDGSADISNTVPSQLARHIAVDNVGRPWVVDPSGAIRKFNGSGWQQQAGGTQGVEIVASADGSIFVSASNTPSIGRYDPQSDTFNFFHMDAAHLAVDGGGQPWAIRAGTGAIYRGALDQM